MKEFVPVSDPLDASCPSRWWGRPPSIQSSDLLNPAGAVTTVDTPSSGILIDKVYSCTSCCTFLPVLGAIPRSSIDGQLRLSAYLPSILRYIRPVMVKPLSFKGDKKPKKRKRTDAGEGSTAQNDNNDSTERQLKKAAKAAEDAPAEADNDDSWVSADAATDIAGPVMFVLPTEPPTALACDANGKVFTLPIENIVDGNPSTAEPHDVRQVWVANRIVGTEHFRLKGHHGKYVSPVPVISPPSLPTHHLSLTYFLDTSPAPKSASSPRPPTPSRPSSPSISSRRPTPRAPSSSKPCATPSSQSKPPAPPKPTRPPKSAATGRK